MSENEKTTSIRTTELALAARLMAAGCKISNVEHVPGRHKRPTARFYFADIPAQLIDDYRTGRDGIAHYETCRKTLIKMCHQEVEQT